MPWAMHSTSTCARRGQGSGQSARRMGPFGSVIISARNETVLAEMVTPTSRIRRQPIARLELPVIPSPRPGLRAPDVAHPAAVAALLADATRAGILALLKGGPHCVCEMAAATGERENNVSNHLARLREAGLVRASRHGADARWVYYERDEAMCASALGELRVLLAQEPGP